MDKNIDRVIENHREMWNWIADAYENGSRIPVGDLKEEYLHIIQEFLDIVSYVIMQDLVMIHAIIHLIVPSVR